MATLRPRGGSLSQSRSTPNLPALDASPSITIDEGTPRTARGFPLPSPPSEAPGQPSRHAHYADAPAEEDEEEAQGEGWEDEEDYGEDEEEDEFELNLYSSSTSESSDSEMSSEASSAIPGDDGQGTSPQKHGTDEQRRWSLSPNRRRSSGGYGGGGAHHGTSGGSPISRSQSHHSLAASFAPPFYNRPHVPLPPSPSLTSLLRPTFSATPSRPTTPDDSENDAASASASASVPASAAAAAAAAAAASSLAQTAARAAPVPRASPKVPTYEYYGFALYLTASAVFALYLLWSFLPSPFLHQLGIYYYPNRWWSLAAPAFVVACIVYVYVALASYNTEVLTLPLSATGNFVDDAANVAVLDAKGRIARGSRVRPGDQTADRTGGGHQQKNRKKDGKGPAGAKKASASTDTTKAEPEQRKSHGRKRDRDRREKKARKEGRDATIAAYEWDWREVWSEGTDAVMDVPIGGVCEVLYG